MPYLAMTVPVLFAALLLLRRLTQRRYITVPSRPGIIPRDVPDGNPDSL